MAVAGDVAESVERRLAVRNTSVPLHVVMIMAVALVLADRECARARYEQGAVAGIVVDHDAPGFCTT
jgi:hypothetical protein